MSKYTLILKDLKSQVDENRSQAEMKWAAIESKRNEYIEMKVDIRRYEKEVEEK